MIWRDDWEKTVQMTLVVTMGWLVGRIDVGRKKILCVGSADLLESWGGEYRGSEYEIPVFVGIEGWWIVA